MSAATTTTSCTVSYSPTSRKVYLETPRGATLPIAVLDVGEADQEVYAPSQTAGLNEKRGISFAAPTYGVTAQEVPDNKRITPLGLVAFLVAQIPLLVELAGYGGERLGPFYAVAAVFLYMAACVECAARKVLSVVVFLAFFWLYIGWSVAHHSASLALLAGGGFSSDPDLMMYTAVLTAILACNAGVVFGVKTQRSAAIWGC